jgi:cation transport regulator ChaB
MMLRSHRYGRRGDDLPTTLQRSSQEAQDAFTEAHRSAVQAYGETDQADLAAFSALKKKFEKCGDRWIAKDQSAD